MRRILLIVAFVTASILIAVGIWFFFFRAPSSPTTPTGSRTTPTTPGGTLPGGGTRLPPAEDILYDTETARPPSDTYARGGLTVAATIAAVPTLGAGASTDGAGVRYYDRDRGQFFTVSDSGLTVAMSEQTFPGVSNVAWAPDADKAILEYPDGSNIIYDFSAQKQTTLPKHWTDLNFAPDGQQIIGKSIGVDPSNRWLMTANADGSGAIPVQELGDNADKVTVAPSPAGHAIAFSKTGNPQGFGRQEILLIGKKKENYKSLIVEGINFEGQWSPDGNRILYSAVSPTDGYRPSLWIVDGGPASIGNNRRKLQISTWADKCTFAGTTRLICAVPQLLDEGAGLSRDTTVNIPDEIWSIDLTSGGRTRLAIPDSQSSISSLFVSDDGQSLTFTDAGSGLLRQIQLNP